MTGCCFICDDLSILSFEVQRWMLDIHRFIKHFRPPELYDVVADPKQRRNLIGTPEGDRLLPELQQQLHRLQAARRLS
jgi:hypothetical protein